MSDENSIRLLRNEKNLIIRAINIMMYGRRRFSFDEKVKKLKEYEEDFLSNEGEKLYNDLTLYKKNRVMASSQEEEMDNLLDEVTAFIKNKSKNIKTNKEEQLTIFESPDYFYFWFDETIDEKRVSSVIHGIFSYINMLYENTEDKIAVNDVGKDFEIGISNTDGSITWCEDFTSFMVELKRRLSIDKDKEFKKHYEEIRQIEKEFVTKSLIESQKR